MAVACYDCALMKFLAQSNKDKTKIIVQQKRAIAFLEKTVRDLKDRGNLLNLN